MPNYTSIFQVLGQYARALAQIENLAERNLSFSSGGETFRSLDKLREEFVDVLNDAPSERDRLDAVGILSDAARVGVGWRSQLRQSLSSWIATALASELSEEGATEAKLLNALQRAMLADTQSVDANAVSLGAVSAGAHNAGDAACYVSKQAVDAAENEIDDERIRNQRINIECVRDHAHHRVQVGQEEFRISPEHGPGVSTRVIPVTHSAITDARNVVTDGAFADETSGSFDHWAAASGAGVFSRDTATKRFGSGALKIIGDGATLGDLQQDLIDRDPVLETGRYWGLGTWVYVSAHTAGSATLDLLIDGLASGLTLTIDGSTASLQWLHLGGLQYISRGSFPNKVKVRIRCSADFNGTVLLDGVSLAAATEVPHAGVRVVLFEGASAPQATPIADRYQLDTTSDEAGAFQTLARDHLGIALPSSGSPTISDSLAE